MNIPASKKKNNAESIVATQGVSGWLVLFCAAVMSVLGIYTLTLGGVANQLAKNWEEALTQSATLRIIADKDAMPGAAAAAEEVLRTTPGIVDYVEITNDEQLALLEPWMGDDLPIEVLNLPRIYSIATGENGIDEDGLRLRLSAEVPQAIWDNHQRWRGPLLQSAKRLRFLSWLSTGIVAISFAALIFVATEASTAANLNSIRLMRQIGATDQWIQAGFVRKFTRRAMIGSLIGVVLGSFATSNLIDTSPQPNSILKGAKFAGFDPALGISILIVTLILVIIATRWATGRSLAKQT